MAPADRLTARPGSDNPLAWIVRNTVFCLLLTARPAIAQGQRSPTICGKPAAYWVAELKADDPTTRSNAVLALALLVPDAKEALPTLISALDDPRKDFQYEIIQQLVEIGPSAAPAAPALVQRLRDDHFVRCGVFRCSHLAGDALAAIGPAAVPSLIEALDSTSEDARGWATNALGRIGPAASAAVPQLDRIVRKHGALEGASAVEALGRIGPAAARAIPTLHAAFDALKLDDDPGTLLEALSQIGAPPSPGLIRRLDDAEPGRRVDAAYLLSRFGPKARSALPRLEAALKDPSPRVRVQAAAALAEIEPANRGVLPTLIEALEGTDVEVIATAIDALEAYGPRASAAVPRIKRIADRNDLTHERFVGFQLQSEIARAKAGAAKALVVIVPDSRDGILAISELVTQGSDLEIEPAIESLADLGPRAASAAPALARVAGDGKSVHRYRAIEALRRIDPSNEAILPALIGFLSDLRPASPNGQRGFGPVLEEEQGEAIAMLGLIGPKALPAVPSLVRVLAAGRPSTRSQAGLPVKAARALGRIGPAAKDAVPALVRALKTEHDFGEEAADALESMENAASSATTELITLLKSEETRPWAARVLGAVGPQARGAVPALVEAVNDENPFVAEVVGPALLRIDPSNRPVVDARLVSIRASNEIFASAVLSGALGHRSEEAIGLTRRLLRELDRALAEREKPLNERIPRRSVNTLDMIEERFRSLARLGVGAAEAVPRLTQLAHHGDPFIQRLAQNALARIDIK